MAKGYQCIVLHAHLPYVRHPEYQSFLEERWLFEALTETYLPLLHILRRLQGKGYRHNVALSLSPPLLTMLQDPFLRGRYRSHMDQLLKLAEKEISRTRDDERFARLARMYQKRLQEVRQTFFDELDGNLIAAFVELHKQGAIELMTSSATHGFLNLLKPEPSSVRAQLKTGAETFCMLTGLQAQGLWLPECGYYEGLEDLIKEAGFSYFFVDSHGLLNGTPRPYYGLTAPVLCPNGIAVFGRDPDSSRQVWSRDEGYPGDFFYRDFYRDIGFDLDLDYIRPHILDGEKRIHTGFKYYRITGKEGDKAVYEPDRAQERVTSHAHDFLFRTQRALASMGQRQQPEPVIFSPYDAELFGHWWFEGIDWLEEFLVLAHNPASTVTMTTPAAYLQANPQLQISRPSGSSWGNGGYNAFWLNEGNDWLYPFLHDAADRMRKLVHRFKATPPESLEYRALQQAGRSLLLAQASDWAFIMKTGTTVEYAYNRTRDHLARFNYLEHALLNEQIDERRLKTLELMDAIFPHLNPNHFS